MRALTEREVRRAIRNCSRGERESMTLPKLDAVPWADLEVLGWRDPRAPLRGYLVALHDDEPVGITVRAAETRVQRAAMCDLCHGVQADGVALFVAPRAGRAGRNGSTLGAYVCDDLACSTNLRAALRPSRQLPDPAPVIAARGAELSRRLAGFVAGVLRDEP